MTFKTKYILSIENQLSYVELGSTLNEWKMNKITKYNEKIEKTYSENKPKLKKKKKQYKTDIEYKQKILQSIFAEINASIHIQQTYKKVFNENIDTLTLRTKIKRNYAVNGIQNTTNTTVTDIDIIGNTNDNIEFICECLSNQEKEWIRIEALKIGRKKDGKNKWYFLNNGHTNNSINNSDKLKNTKHILIAIPNNYTIIPEGTSSKEDYKKRQEIRNCIKFLEQESKNLKKDITLLKMPYEWDGKKMFPEGERQITTNTIDKIYELFIEDSPDSVNFEDVLNILYSEKDQEKLFEEKSN